MCTGSYGWFRCEKVKCRSKIKSVFNFSQYNLAPLRRNQRLQLLLANTENKHTEMVVTLENGVQTIRMNRPTKYNAIALEVRK